MTNNTELLEKFNSEFLPPIGTVYRDVLMRLADLNIHNKDDLKNVVSDKAARDVIKVLRRKYKYRIHNVKGGWKLDERHFSDNEKLVRLARAESNYNHAEHSLQQVKREKKREEKAIRRKLDTAEELQKVKAE